MGTNGVYLWSSGSISSLGGNIIVNGYGTSFGVNLVASGLIHAAGSGTIEIEGTGEYVGVGVSDVAGTVSSSGGVVTITGITDGPEFFTGIQIFGMVNTSINGGNINLIADHMDIAGDVMTNNASIVSLRPYTQNESIDLGSSADPTNGPLSLSNSELSNISTGTLIIGSESSGSITVSADITFSEIDHIQLFVGDGAMHVNPNVSLILEGTVEILD